MKISLPALIFPAFLLSFSPSCCVPALPLVTLAVLSGFTVVQTADRAAVSEEVVAQKNDTQNLTEQVQAQNDR